ncbi:3-phosphoserine/phosphohydroxythreonine aminotransferase [compost metagenome]
MHICSNETIHGVEFHELPDLKALGCDAPLVIDFSSHVASQPRALRSGSSWNSTPWMVSLLQMCT